LRREFDQQHYIRLPQLLHSELLRKIERQLPEDDFSEMVHEGVGTEFVIKDGVAPRLLNFVVNRRAFFSIVEQITGCGRIGCFSGRVYRMVPSEGHHDSWHDDIDDAPAVAGAEVAQQEPTGRLIALSMNLSEGPYAGGALQIRDKKTREILREVRNVVFGDAIIFRLAPHLQHKVAEVKGNVAKTAFAGWFLRRPDFEAMYTHQQWSARSAQSGPSVRMR